MRGGVVSGVEVVGVGRELGGQGVNLLDPWPDAELQSDLANLILGAANSQGNLLVGETELLGLENVLLLEPPEAANLLKLLGAVNNVLQLVEEPLVDLGQLVHAINRVVLVKHGLTNGQPSAVGGVLELEVEVLELVTLEADKPRVDLADGLLERLLKGTADSHNLTDRLHGTADIALDVLEFGQIPSGDLGNDIIKRGLEVGGRGLGHGVGKLGQAVAQADLGCGVGQGVTGGLGGQSGRTGKTGVDLDNPVVETIRLKSVLNVALADDTQMTNDLDGGRSEHVVLLVAQRLTGRNDDGIASVDAQGVEVLHVANRNAVVIRITNDLIFDLLPALQGLLNQNLGRECKRSGSHVSQLLLVVGETGSKTTERIRSADDNGIPNLLGSIESLIDGVDGDRLGDGDVNLLKGLCEEISVFAELQRPDAGAKNLDAVLLEQAELLHLHTEVEGGLAAEGEEDTIGLLPLDHVLNVLGRHGEIVDLVGEDVVRLDGGDIGVDEHRGNASLLEGLESLGSYAHPFSSVLNLIDPDCRVTHNSSPPGKGERGLLLLSGATYQSNRTLQPGQWQDRHCQ